MGRFIKYIIILTIIGFGGTLFYKKVYIPKTTYETFSPLKGDLNVQVFGIGNVGARDTYVITAQTGGRVLSILTDEGEWVKKGALLVTIDSVDIPQLLEEARIGVKKADSELVASEKELQSLMAQKSLAEVTFRRYAKLQKQSFASKAEYDKAKADLDTVKAQIEATKAHITTARTEITRAEKGVESLTTKLSRYKIYAPVDGYVISKDVQRDQTVLPSQSILKIVDPKTVWIKAYIDEKLSGSVKVGQQATITLRSQQDKRFKGMVKRIVAQSDAVTQEREVNIAFEKLPLPFYINEQAEVMIDTKTYENILKIPTSAVSYYEGKAGVWVDEEKKAHFKTIKILARGEKELAISGVDEADKILIESPKKKSLNEGMRIH